MPIYGSIISSVRNLRATQTMGGNSKKGGNKDGNVYGHEHDDVYGAHDV